MGKYSSNSDSSSYSTKKKSRHKRSSSRSSSSSRYSSSRSKKSKKSKKYHRRSGSSERSSKHRRSSRDRSSRKSKHSKHSRRRSRSSSRSKHSSNKSPSYSSRSHSKDKRSRSPSYRRLKRSPSRSPSFSSRSNDKRSPLFDGAELLAKLNKAATEAMSENTKKLESLFSDNQESRNKAINEINAPHFIQKSFTTGDRKEDAPLVSEVSNFVNFNTLKEEQGSLLHPNLLIEDQNEKMNRWIRKLYQLRQKALYGEPLLYE